MGSEGLGAHPEPPQNPQTPGSTLGDWGNQRADPAVGLPRARSSGVRVRAARAKVPMRPNARRSYNLQQLHWVTAGICSTKGWRGGGARLPNSLQVLPGAGAAAPAEFWCLLLLEAAPGPRKDFGGEGFWGEVWGYRWFCCQWGPGDVGLGIRGAGDPWGWVQGGPVSPRCPQGILSPLRARSTHGTSKNPSSSVWGAPPHSHSPLLWFRAARREGTRWDGSPASPLPVVLGARLGVTGGLQHPDMGCGAWKRDVGPGHGTWDKEMGRGTGTRTWDRDMGCVTCIWDVGQGHGTRDLDTGPPLPKPPPPLWEQKHHRDPNSGGFPSPPVPRRGAGTRHPPPK